MSLKDFLGEVRDYRKKHGLRAFRYALEDGFRGGLGRIGFWYNYGEHIFNEDWDMLIVLDGCRWDVMEEIIDEYDWIESFETRRSLASHSSEWMRKTFMQRPSGLDKIQMLPRFLKNPDDIDIVEDYWKMSNSERLEKTSFVTWNLFAKVLDENSFKSFESLRNSHWDNGMVDPRGITSHTIDHHRKNNPNYLIAHYMQPHAPFREGDTTNHETPVWQRVRTDDKPYNQMWEEYKDDLRWVMDDIELLIENVDADKVAITADHGNAIGEWGCYGHRPYVPIDGMKKVPWIETTATDKRTYEPEIEELDEIDQSEMNERLKSLGYL